MNIDEISIIKQEFSSLLINTADEKSLEELRIRFLGKKGSCTELLKKLGSIPPEERPSFGQKVNELKNFITEALKQKNSDCRSVPAVRDFTDIRLPGRLPIIGSLHPLTQVEDEICAVFEAMGFIAVDGPEIETDYYNFEALNIPAEHPARDTQDSFYLDPARLLRTQTSPVQVRTMEKIKPPLSIISPGRVFRRDTSDASHSPVFHQIEGLVVDRGITFADLKGLLVSFCRSMFGSSVRTRFRPDFFPFTEPSCDISVSCVLCGGKGCRTCGEGWLEVLGAGLVNPKVFEFAGINPEEYSGLAFGIGIERIAMLKFGIEDIRIFFENDIRFLSQFI
ncbi:MAG TPA: phenylalanine--tRNA ligase subunit alpha [Spirochaetia bacterium]|nr:phenylalanine--tRNA ligase subunit alpha [Spirochaetia bacterium]